MDQQIDQLFKLSGDQHRYQYFTLTLTFLFWINTCFIAVSISLLEKPPLVTYINSDNVNITEPLTYDICDKYEFTILSPPHSSWVLDFGIYCDRTRTGLIGSFIFIGFASGAILFPIITRFLTHKPIMIVAFIVFSIIMSLCTLLRNYYWIIMSSIIFLAMFSNFGSYSSLVATEEIVSAEKRVLFGSIINSGYSTAGIVYVALFYFLNNWIHVFYCAVGFIIIIGLLIVFFIYDSPRGYIIRNNVTKTVEILRGIARFNNRLEEFDEGLKEPEYIETLKAIEGNKDYEKNDTNTDENSNEKNDNLLNKKNSNENSDNLHEKSNEKITAFSLLKYPSVRKKLLALCFLFLFTNCIYDGIVIGAKNLPGNIYRNVILLYIMEAISYYITGILTNTLILGRKRTILGMYIITITCMLCIVFINIPDDYELVLFLIARFCISGVCATNYTYSLENYPTPLRTLGFGINTTCGNAGSIMITMVIEHVDRDMMLLYYAGIMVLDCLVLMIFLKETVGLPMPETIEEINDLTQIKISTNNSKIDSSPKN